GITLNNYAVNFGNTIMVQAQASPWQGVTFGGAPFGNRFTVRLTDISDGTSSTLLAAEVIQGWGGDTRGDTWDGIYPGFEAFYGPNSPSPDQVGPGGGCLYPYKNNPPCVLSGYDQYAARSRHPGGVHAALCDGSVRFATDTIELAIWRALSTASGEETVGDW